jgi:hypothetical protein
MPTLAATRATSRRLGGRLMLDHRGRVAVRREELQRIITHHRHRKDLHRHRGSDAARLHDVADDRF